MHIVSYKPLYLLVVLAMLGLAACDAVGEQKIDWRHGNSLSITGPQSASSEAIPYDGYAPGKAYFLVDYFNADQSYEWSVSPELPTEVLRYGELFSVSYDSASTFVVHVTTTIEGKEYSGADTVTISLPAAVIQIERLPQFSSLATAVQQASLTLPESNVTVLAPTNEAFTAAFDANGDGTLETDELPKEDALADILKRHVIPKKLTTEDVTSGASYETLGGDEVTFQRSGDAVSVLLDGTKAATLTATDVPVNDGVIHAIDGVLLPE